MLGPSGALYGTTYSGGGSPGWGTVYQLSPPTMPGGLWTESLLYTFQGGADGANPEAGLIIGANNILYGTTVYGGTLGYGTVFQLVPPTSPGGAWTETAIYSFQGGTDGANPQSGVLAGSTGILYGTTTYGGSAGFGTVFQLVPPTSSGAPWKETLIYTFLGGADGANPMTNLLIDKNNVLYGTTYQGGTPGWGTVFQLIPGTPWKEKVLYSFTGLTDGGGPESPLVKGPGGSFYGATFWAGNATSVGCTLGGFAAGCGTVYQLKPPSVAGGKWTLGVVYAFKGTGTDGAHPFQAMTTNTGGSIYLTTYSGGSSTDLCFGHSGYPGCGTIFQFKPPSSSGGTWTKILLHTFGGPDGGGPNGVFFSTAGTLYGTTYLGGNARSDGTAFELMP